MGKILAMNWTEGGLRKIFNKIGKEDTIERIWRVVDQDQYVPKRILKRLDCVFVAMKCQEL